MNVLSSFGFRVLSVIRLLLPACIGMSLCAHAEIAADRTGVSNSVGDNSTSVINVIEGEQLDFPFSASNPNPAATPPGISSFTLLINNRSQEATATFTKLAEGVFVARWTATLPQGYPAGNLLQTLAVQYSIPTITMPYSIARITIPLGRVDVAEWEGTIAGLRTGNYASVGPSYHVHSHYGGKYSGPVELLGSGSSEPGSTWYRGPKSISLLQPDGSPSGTSAQITNSARYPLFFFPQSSGVPQLLDVSNPDTYPDNGTWYKNELSGIVNVKNPTIDTISSGQMKFVLFPATDPRDNFNMAPILQTYLESSSEIKINETLWRYIDGTGERKINMVEFCGSSDWPRAFRNYFDLKIGAKIVPYTAGTSRYEGLPIDVGPAIPLLTMASETWHKFVLKVGPDAAAVSNGIEIVLGSGNNGGDPPQLGFEVQKRVSGGFEPLSLPGGRITLAPVEYQKITSVAGLELFIRRSEAVTQMHKLKIQLIPKKSGREPGLIAQSDLLPMEFLGMWETKNKANQIVMKARRDDPTSSNQGSDLQGNLYGTPRNILYVAADPSDGECHVSLNITSALRNQFICAAYKSGNKINGTDKSFPADPEKPANIRIPATGNGQSGDDYSIKVAFDANGNRLLDITEKVIELDVLKGADGTPSLVPMVRGFSLQSIAAAKSTINGQAFSLFWNGGWIPNVPNDVAPLIVPNAIQLLRLFYTGDYDRMEDEYEPSDVLPDATLNALGSAGDFSEWLSHNVGSKFIDGVTNAIKHYNWNANSPISKLIAGSAPLTELKELSSIVSQMENDTTDTVEAYKQIGIAVGQSQVFPNPDGHDLQAELVKLGVPHWSPPWVSKQTLVIGREEDYFIKIPDEANKTVGRSRFVNGKYWFVVKKENRTEYLPGPMTPSQEVHYTAVVVYLRIRGTSQDLYDFNHNCGGFGVPAAITQLSYGNGTYGRFHGIIYRTSVGILTDYQMKVIRLP
jgi:hypothetical protein